MPWNLTGPCKNKPCSDHPWISSIVIHGPLPVATLCNPSSHWHLFAVESQRNAKVLAMIRFMSRNVIWNLLSNPFPQRWKKKKKKRKRKIADQVQTHACWLFGTHSDEVKPAFCSKLGGLSFLHQPKLQSIPTNYNCTPSFLGHAKTYTHTQHRLVILSRTQKLYPWQQVQNFWEWPTEPKSTSGRKRCTRDFWKLLLWWHKHKPDILCKILQYKLNSSSFTGPQRVVGSH